jgi:hypothetical protein
MTTDKPIFKFDKTKSVTKKIPKNLDVFYVLDIDEMLVTKYGKDKKGCVYILSRDRLKYALHPDRILSKTDRQIHKIGYEQLISLYGLKQEDCILFEKSDRLKHDVNKYIHLFPLFNGNYEEHLSYIKMRGVFVRSLVL